MVDWRDGNLDMLVSMCEIAGMLRFHLFEYMWSCFKWLAGVSLPITLCLQPLEKERVVFSNALNMLKGHWDGKKNGGHEVT